MGCTNSPGGPHELRPGVCEVVSTAAPDAPQPRGRHVLAESSSSPTRPFRRPFNCPARAVPARAYVNDKTPVVGHNARPRHRKPCARLQRRPGPPSQRIPAATHNDRQKIVGAQSTSSVDESDPRCSTSAHARGGATNLAVVRMSSTHVAHSPAAASHTSRNHSCCSFSDRPDVFISSENRCSSCCWSSTYAEADVGYGRLQVA